MFRRSALCVKCPQPREFGPAGIISVGLNTEMASWHDGGETWARREVPTSGRGLYVRYTRRKVGMKEPLPGNMLLSFCTNNVKPLILCDNREDNSFTAVRESRQQVVKLRGHPGANTMTQTSFMARKT